MSGEEIRTARQARRLLGLDETAGRAALGQAFRAAVRVAHPDRGGDAARLRAVVDAYRLLSDLGSGDVLNLTPAVRRPGPIPLPLVLTAREAACGGAKSLRLPDGRRGRLQLPAGLRAGDRLRMGGATGPLMFQIGFAHGDNTICGDDIWVTALVAPQLLQGGGWLNVDTPAGRKGLTITPEAAARGVARLLDHGLPPRGPHRRGHLFVRLQADRTMSERRASELLARFTAAWAA